MPPNTEPLQRMRSDAQSHHPCKEQSSYCQGYRTEASGAEISDNQECAEKYQRRPKVVHNGKQPADYHGIADEQDQIPLIHDPVHGGGSGIDKANLRKLRGLQRHPADNEPVFGAVILRAENQRHRQESHARDHGKIPEPLCPLQVPQ